MTSGDKRSPLSSCLVPLTLAACLASLYLISDINNTMQTITVRADEYPLTGEIVIHEGVAVGGLHFEAITARRVGESGADWMARHLEGLELARGVK